MRTCRRCGATKPLEDFVKVPQCHYGRAYTCRTCKSAATRAWKEAHPDGAPKRERVEGSWARRNPGRARVVVERRRRENGLAQAAQNAALNAKRRGAEVRDLVVPLVVFEMDDGVCGICGEDVDPLNFHVDHVVAIPDGGEHSYENVQLAHPVCNARKGVKERDARKAAA